MNGVLLRRAMKLNNSRKHRKWWQRAVRVIAMIVVFCTTYALILPAITMEGKPECGMEAHTHEQTCCFHQTEYRYLCLPEADAKVVHSHNEFCYDKDGNLVCPLPEIAEHAHTDACYETELVLICTNVHAHDEQCNQREKVLICEKEECAPHAHDENCNVTQTVLICQIPESEEHVHSNACYTVRETSCSIAETEGHTHGDECYEEREILCELTTNDGHVHEDSCYETRKTVICGLEELVIHTHGAECVDSDGNLICEMAEVIAHDHTADCQIETEDKETLICQIPEHVHNELCYPMKEEEQDQHSEYLCGFSVHTHGESCYNEKNECICTVPEHKHEAACMVADLDLTADQETAEQWEASLKAVKLSHDWNQNVLAVAVSQLDYTESKKNVILEDETLKGYTRYGAWYGDPYGDWDAMFASFVIHYAQVKEYPLESNGAAWVDALMEKGLFFMADADTAKPGDLIFFDVGRNTAPEDESELNAVDHVGIVVELIPASGEEPAKIKTIEGNRADKVSYAVYSIDDPSIMGYGKMIANPLTEEEWSAAVDAAAEIQQLPAVETVQKAFEELNEQGDKAGFEALRQELITRIQSILNAYETFNELQLEYIDSLDNLYALQTLCGGENWKDFAPLTDDSAVLTQLTVSGSEVERANVTDGSDNEDLFVNNADVIRFAISAAAESYYSDLRFGEARVKVQLMLPLMPDKACFLTEEMTWLEEAALVIEERDGITYQILTGYKRMTGTDSNAVAVPGSFTEKVPVQIVNMAHGDTVRLTVSAAMEFSAWQETCETHQTEETLTVQTNLYSVYAPKEERGTTYKDFLSQITMLNNQNISAEEKKEAAQVILDQVVEAYYNGMLTLIELEELGDALRNPLGYISEYATGTAWMLGITVTVTEPVQTESQARVMMMQSRAMSSALYAEVFPSASQIIHEGGSNTSSEGAVMVSKTIEGTDTENVFDITLQIITKDEVNEVYKDPDMAVVVVMDISNTMRSSFGSTSRYQAAMTAGENFLKKFAEQNSTLSRVGYVAFNTSAHEIFDLSSCNTTAQATSLTNTMKTKTGNIINASGYADSKTRYTNMEAGLKMAYNMLSTANNQHKYIIFISDGFPTTYVKSGTTGYEPYSSSGSNNVDGVFYDAVRKVHCDYGTSYSDTAAIKARELAVELKEKGVNIFSIGVDVGGQNLWDHHNHAGGMNGGFSVVERRRSLSYYTNTGYEIGTKHSMLTKSSVTAAEKTAMAQDFKDWLKGSATTGIGSGYYYDSTNLSGLNAAYDSIFAKILELNASSSHLDWVASDPMPDMGVHEVNAMEFISFWDLDSNGDWVLKADDLTGESKDGNLYDNTADFHEDTQTIHWDLKKSGYISQAAGNSTYYRCELKYRIRLRNEEEVFVERDSYDTNDVTTLTYRIIEVDGENTSISERRTVNFPIPAVEGYLAELNFQKVDNYGQQVFGAEFTLSHDTANCGYCRGDGESHVVVKDFVATSDSNGLVSFSKIPSGHTYSLTETKVPEGYRANGNSYQVTVAYDNLTVTVKDQNGNALTWEQFIENNTSYRLPETGGAGTSFYTLSGLLVVTVAAGYVILTARKRQKGGNRE